MTSPGQYGSHQYQSPETRALASITAESYDKDQAKTIIKLKNDVGYMAAYMRKMQKSIDQANENFIQQIQSFIADFIVLLGGGSLTTIDFGDLRYVLQAIGALLGFQTVAGIPIPINLFTAAWNFFGIYIAPTQQFADVINELIDAAISIIIDALGDIPVFGQSIEQLAAFLIEIRDALWPLIDTVFLLIDTLSGQPDTEPQDVMTGLFDQIIDILLTTPDVLLQVTNAVVNVLMDTPEILLALLNGLISLLINSPDILTTLLDSLVNLLVSIPSILETLLTGLITLLLELPNMLGELLASLINLLLVTPDILVSLLSGLITLLIDSPQILLDLLTSLVGLLVATPSILLELADALIGSTGLLGEDSALNSLNLFNLVPTDLMAQISVSNIGTAVTNLITDSDFLDTSVIEGWLHDVTGGFGGSGTRYTTADGTSKELLGNLIPVSADQIIPISGKAKWTGLAGSGNPIALAVTGYTDTGASVQQTLASHNIIPATTDWLDLAGTYTVPSNVTAIRPRLVVGSAATAGTVFFSKTKATKTQPLLQKLIAGTDPGTFLPDDITHLFTGISTNALELLNKAGLTDFNELMATIGGEVGDDITAVETRLNDFLGTLSPLNASNINQGNIGDLYVPGLGSINDNIVTKLLGIGGSGFGHTDAGSALQSTTFALVDTSSRLAQLENTFTGGVSEGDDFERVSSTSLGAGWLTFYQGGAGIWATPNGHDASFAPSGVADRNFFSIRNSGNVRSTTDLQRVMVVLGTKATEFFGYTGHNDVLLRISDATTGWANLTAIVIRFGGDGSVSIIRYVNGVGTVLNSKPAGSIVPPGPGASIWGEAGMPGTARYFRGGLGTSMLIEIPEVGSASQVGAAFRRWGHGGRGEGHLLPLPGQEKPGAIHQWTAKDLVG